MKMKCRFTEHSGQARIFAKRVTAARWAKGCDGKVMKIGINGFVVVTEKGWLK